MYKGIFERYPNYWEGENVRHYADFVTAFGLLQCLMMSGLNKEGKYNTDAILWHAIDQVEPYYLEEYPTTSSNPSITDALYGAVPEYYIALVQLIEFGVNKNYVFIPMEKFTIDNLLYECTTYYIENILGRIPIDDLLRFADHQRIKRPKGNRSIKKDRKVRHYKSWYGIGSTTEKIEVETWRLEDGTICENSYDIVRNEHDFRNNLRKLLEKRWIWRNV